VLHQAGQEQDVFPLTLDLECVRDARENGIKGLGQVLKSFRDARLSFACYDSASPPSAHLQALGALELRTRVK
jgi:hypothetical protein